MEAIRSTRVPLNNVAKQPANKGRVTRQPLSRIGNKGNTIASRKPSVKEKSEGKDLKQVKKPLPVQKEEVAEAVLEPVAFSAFSLPEGVDDIDKDDELNPQLVSCYVNDIYMYLRKLEAKHKLKRNFLEGQAEITSKMRAVLIDWLIQVHSKFHLLQETLFLTVSLIDRFMQIEKVRRSKLQLVGVTSMFIAAKFEEMYAPEVGDFVYITDNAYTKQDILRMELLILYRLDFSLGRPLPLHFLRRNSKAGNVDSSMHTLAKYLMELHLVEYDLAYYSPSAVAAAALYLSIKLLDDGEWTATLIHYSGYKEEEILPIVSKMCKVLLALKSSRFQAVTLKYASSKLMKISTIPELGSEMVKNLAAGSIKAM